MENLRVLQEWKRRGTNTLPFLCSSGIENQIYSRYFLPSDPCFFHSNYLVIKSGSCCFYQKERNWPFLSIRLGLRLFHFSTPLRYLTQFGPCSPNDVIAYQTYQRNLIRTPRTSRAWFKRKMSFLCVELKFKSAMSWANLPHPRILSFSLTWLYPDRKYFLIPPNVYLCSVVLVQLFDLST